MDNRVVQGNTQLAKCDFLWRGRQRDASAHAALFGRVWCGWICPQTVYLEFLYRPLQRLFDGPPGPRHRLGKKRTAVRTVFKFASYLAVSAFLAHTFPAYFVGVEHLAQWVRSSPLEHPTAFLVMALTTAAMMSAIR